MVTADVPELVTVAPLEPADTVRIPSPTDSVTVITPEPASGSLIDRPAALRSSGVCSVALRLAWAIVAVGAWLARFTVRLTVAGADWPSPSDAA